MIKTDIPIFCKGRSSTRYNHEGEDQTRNNEENKWKYKELQQPRDAKILDSQGYNTYWASKMYCIQLRNFIKHVLGSNNHSLPVMSRPESPAPLKISVRIFG